MHIKTTLLLGAALAVTLGAQDASAAHRQAGTCTTNPLQYTTIQSAVNAAQAGDQVQVCPGTWQEEVVIATSITLTNVPSMAIPTIAFPAGGAVANGTSLSGHSDASQILVLTSSGANKVNIKNLIVDGSGNNVMSCGGPNPIGIHYQNAGGSITSTTVENQLLPSGYQGCQLGLGIYVENQTTGTPALIITDNTVTNFDKNGITTEYKAATGTISNNTVTGLGPTTVIAQNGIQVSYGASGTVKGNTVSNLIYSPTPESSGILLYDTWSGNYLAAPRVLGNTVTDADNGIISDASGGASGALLAISKNTVSGSTSLGVGTASDYGVLENGQVSADYNSINQNMISGTTLLDDIDVCSDYNSINTNTDNPSPPGAPQSGIHLDSTCTQADTSTSGVHNSVAADHINNNCVGILSGPAAGLNTIHSNNVFTGNTNNYIYGTNTYSCGPHRKGAKVTMAPVQPLAL
jgi:hypothetical protein